MSVMTFDFNEAGGGASPVESANIMQELRQNFYREVYERNIVNAFGCLCEAGYQFKFRNIVWESEHEDESLIEGSSQTSF